MSTTNTTAANGNLDSVLPIRAVSGGERGKEGSGVKHDYLMPKAIFMALIGEVFDKEVERSKPENAKSGGAVAQFCHSYGATADKQEKSGINPFPETVYAVVHARSTTGMELFTGTKELCEAWIRDHKADEPEAVMVPAKEQNLFTGENVESWLEVMEFKAPKGKGSRKSAKEVRMDAILTVLTVPGVTWEMIKGAYGDVSSEELEDYKAKLATPKEEGAE